MMVFDRTHVKLILYVVSYSVLVFARFRRGIVRSDADTISRASLEITNVAALLFALGADYGAQGKPGVRYTFGRKRLHVLVALVMCVVVIVNCVLNLAEVLDDLSWIPDKDTMWEKKEINILQCAVGMVGLGLFRHVHHFRVKRAEHSNQKGVYLHGLATTLDAVVTLIISLIFSNQQTLCLVLNFFGTLTVGVVSNAPKTTTTIPPEKFLPEPSSFSPH